MNTETCLRCCREPCYCGTIEARYDWLTEELEARFPGLVDSSSSASQEPKLLSAIDELKRRAEKSERERDEAVARYANFRATYTSEREAIADEEAAAVTRDLVAAQAEIAELKDMLAGRDEYNHELRAALDVAQSTMRDHDCHLESPEADRIVAIALATPQNIALPALPRRDLAAAQARERELRAALAAYLVTDSTGTQRSAKEQFSVVRSARERLSMALSAPQDTTALREFGLKVKETTCVAIANGRATEAVVDAVLKGDVP